MGNAVRRGARQIEAQTDTSGEAGVGTSRSADARATASSGISVTPVSWAAERNLDFARWVAHGRRLGLITRGAQWWIGDWLRYGHRNYRDRYVNAGKITGYESQTLMNLAYVASRVSVSRRREKLSWSHHAEVAPLPPDQQESWLRKAEEEGLSVRSMRAALRDASQCDHASGVAALRVSSEIVCPECGHRFTPYDSHAQRATDVGSEDRDANAALAR